MEEWNLKEYLALSGGNEANQLMRKIIDIVKATNDDIDFKPLCQGLIKDMTELKLDLTKDKVKPEDYEYYTIWAKAWNKNIDEYITLTKEGLAHEDDLKEWAKENFPEAYQEYQDGKK